MPEDAAATAIVDLILPPDEMVGELQRYFDMRVHGLDGVERLFTGQEHSFRDILDVAGHRARSTSTAARSRRLSIASSDAW